MKQLKSADGRFPTVAIQGDMYSSTYFSVCDTTDDGIGSVRDQ
jgi:hypothetical protein